MNRICVTTDGIHSWRMRLANPERQWKRGFSAFETAVSWELASDNESGLPLPIESVLRTVYLEPSLQFAIAEHKVRLPGGKADSQCDVWALVKTSGGNVSVSIEAKVKESFGKKTLSEWLAAGKSKRSLTNRKKRWEYIREHLPNPNADYSNIAYQLLHRCASAVIEAKRLQLEKASFLVQQFTTSKDHFDEFQRLCEVINVSVDRGCMILTSVGEVELGIGWADCHRATDREIDAVH